MEIWEAELSKSSDVIVKNKSTTIFHGLHVYHRFKWCQNVQNFAVKPLACGSWFHLSFEHFNIISMVHKSTDHGKLLLI